MKIYLGPDSIVVAPHYLQPKIKNALSALKESFFLDFKSIASNKKFSTINLSLN